jgi:hypothetical protein
MLSDGIGAIGFSWVRPIIGVKLKNYSRMNFTTNLNSNLKYNPFEFLFHTGRQPRLH